MLGRVVVEREQRVELLGDLRGRLGELRTELDLEGLRRNLRVLLVLGVVDLGERRLRRRVRRLRQRGEDIALDVEPAALLGVAPGSCVEARSLDQYSARPPEARQVGQAALAMTCPGSPP